MDVIRDVVGYAIGYPDIGCKLSPTCLACTLPVCVHDMPAPPPPSKADKQAVVACLVGRTFEAVATQFGISLRTLHRYQKEVREWEKAHERAR